MPLINDPPDLWAAYVGGGGAGGDAARNALVMHYLPLARIHAARLAKQTRGLVEADELLQDAVFGLIDAIRVFRPDRGVNFETFSYRRIHGAAVDGMRRRDWVPRRGRNKQTRGPGVVPVMDSLESIEGVQYIPEAEGGAGLERVDGRSLRRVLMRDMGRRERLIIALRFDEEMTLNEIGRVVGITESRVSQTLVIILNRLRATFDGRRDELMALAAER